MVPNFALSLSFEGISLLRRMPQGWARLDDVSLSEVDLDTAMADLRDTALGIDPKGDKVLLIIPNEQIRYLDLPDPGGDGAARKAAAAAALDGATPYAVADLAFDYTSSGGHLHVAAVARETLDEAEAFASLHGFTPVGLAARAPAGAFDGPVWFGAASAWGSRKVSPLAKPITLVESTEEAFQPVAPRKKPGPKAATEPASEAQTAAETTPEIAPEIARERDPQALGDTRADGSAPSPAPQDDSLAEPPVREAASKEAAEEDEFESSDLMLFKHQETPGPSQPEPQAPEDLDKALLAEAGDPASDDQDQRDPPEAGTPNADVSLALKANAAQPGKAPADPSPTDAAFASSRAAPPLAPPDRRIPNPASGPGAAAPIKPRFTPVPPVSHIKMRDAAPDPLPKTPASKAEAPPPAPPLPDMAAERVSETVPDPAASPDQSAKTPAANGQPQTEAPAAPETARDRVLRAASASGLTSRLPLKGLSGDTSKPRKGFFGRLGRKSEDRKSEGSEAPDRDAAALPPLVRPAETPKAASSVEAAPVIPQIKAPASPDMPRLSAPSAKAPEAAGSDVGVPKVKTPEVKAPEVTAPASSPAKPSASPIKAKTKQPAKSAVGSTAAARLAALTSRSRKAAPPDTAAPVPAKAPVAKASVAKALTSDEERERMTVFGARGNDGIGGKPRFLGLGLTLGLLLFLMGVAAWASVFMDNGVARFFRGEDAPVQTASLSLPEAAQTSPAQTSPALSEPVAGASSDPPPETSSESTGQTAPAMPAPPLIQPLEPAETTVEDEAQEDIQLAALETVAPSDATPALREPVPQRPPTPQEAELSYAATGIWQLNPDAPATPPTDGVDDVYVASIDPSVRQFDAVALPTALSVAPEAGLPPQGLPPPADMRFDFDPRGLIRATPEGALSPEGLRIYRGLPPVVPPLRTAAVAPLAPPVPETPSDAPEALPAALPPPDLLRPEARPDDLIEQRERATLGGISLQELAAFRPLLRPRTAQEEAQTAEPDTPSTDQAVARSLVPVNRPRDMAGIISRAEAQRAVQTAPEPEPVRTAAVAPRTVQPSGPTATSVSRAATVPNAINLNRVSLIGVYGTDANRRALVRLPNGKYEKVKPGDRLDGGRVTAIKDSELLYNKAGRSLSLKMPRG